MNLSGSQDLIKSQFVSDHHTHVELVHSVNGGLLHRRVVTKDEDSVLLRLLHCPLQEDKDTRVKEDDRGRNFFLDYL